MASNPELSNTEEGILDIEQPDMSGSTNLEESYGSQQFDVSSTQGLSGVERPDFGNSMTDSNVSQQLNDSAGGQGAGQPNISNGQHNMSASPQNISATERPNLSGSSMNSTPNYGCPQFNAWAGAQQGHIGTPVNMNNSYGNQQINSPGSQDVSYGYDTSNISGLSATERPNLSSTMNTSNNSPQSNYNSPSPQNRPSPGNVAPPVNPNYSSPRPGPGNTVAPCSYSGNQGNASPRPMNNNNGGLQIPPVPPLQQPDRFNWANDYFLARSHSPFDDHVMPQLSPGNSPQNARPNTPVPPSDDFIIRTLLSDPSFADVLRRTVHAQCENIVRQMIRSAMEDMVPRYLSHYLNDELGPLMDDMMNNGILPRPQSCNCTRERRTSEQGFLQNSSFLA